MKKIFIAAVALAFTYNAFPQGRFNAGNYDFESSAKNTSADELPMSPYQDGYIAFFRNDTAYKFRANSEFEIDSLIRCPELTGLGIEGTFAYDRAGKKLYFSKNGKDGNELYEAAWTGDKWENVRKLQIKGTTGHKKEVTGSSLAAARWTYYEDGVTGFYNPSMDKNGKRIYFSGTFKAGKGDRDLWYIDKEDDEWWSFPQSAGGTINTEAREDFGLAVGDTTFFFASTRPDGSGQMDMYVAYKKANAAEWGQPENLGDKINSSANDYNIAFNGSSIFFISDRPGGKGKADIYRAAPIAPEAEPELPGEINLTEPKEFQWVLFHFDFDVAKLKSEYLAQVDELAETIKANFPNARFEVIGHTDSRGSDAYNMGLSQRRADNIKELLVARGINPNNLTSVAKGKRELLIINAKTKAEHEENRRVEVRIINQ